MSRKTSGKTKKAAPISLAWLRQVIDREWPDDAPAKGSIVAVAAYFIKSGDPDGRNVFPAIDTMARDLRLGRRTVLDVIKTMQAEGMLERVGKIRTGTINYRLRLEAVEVESVSESASDSVPRSALSSAQRGTLPTTYDRKGVGGGGDSSPDGNTPAAVATGSETGDAKPIVPAVMIDDDRANRIIIDFITAFDARFAERARGKTVATQRLEPHHDKLRLQIVTKMDAGWPQDHLINRIIGGLPPDDRKIDTLTGLVAAKLHRIPDKPDATAQLIINEGEVAAAAQLKLDEADRKQRETIQKRRRDQALDRYRKTLIDYRWVVDVDAEVAAFIEINDTDDGTFDSLLQREAWQLCDEWIGGVEYEIKWVIENASTERKEIDALIKDTRKALDYEGCPDKLWDERIASALAAANLDLDKITMHANHDMACKTLREFINRLTRCDDRGMTINELIAERKAYYASIDDDRVMQALTGTAELIQTSEGSTW